MNRLFGRQAEPFGIINKVEVLSVVGDQVPHKLTVRTDFEATALHVVEGVLDQGRRQPAMGKTRLGFGMDKVDDVALEHVLGKGCQIGPHLELVLPSTLVVYQAIVGGLIGWILRLRHHG